MGAARPRCPKEAGHDVVVYDIVYALQLRSLGGPAEAATNSKSSISKAAQTAGREGPEIPERFSEE
jgi:hypothetical protein